MSAGWDLGDGADDLSMGLSIDGHGFDVFILQFEFFPQDVDFLFAFWFEGVEAAGEVEFEVVPDGQDGFD